MGDARTARLNRCAALPAYVCSVSRHTFCKCPSTRLGSATAPASCTCTRQDAVVLSRACRGICYMRSVSRQTHKLGHMCCGTRKRLYERHGPQRPTRRTARLPKWASNDNLLTIIPNCSQGNDIDSKDGMGSRRFLGRNTRSVHVLRCKCRRSAAATVMLPDYQGDHIYISSRRRRRSYHCLD